MRYTAKYRHTCSVAQVVRTEDVRFSSNEGKVEEVPKQVPHTISGTESELVLNTGGLTPGGLKRAG